MPDQLHIYVAASEWIVYRSEIKLLQNKGGGAVSDFSLISDLSKKFKHDLWRVKPALKLSQKQHLTPDIRKRTDRHIHIWT